MELDLRLQRALDRVELVSGTIGNPGDGRMCLMSLVAFLAGEGHSDSPDCASPLIQAFAIRINDNMPHEARQRLKAFAPRIIGTNDGCDGLRAQVLRRVLANGALARALEHGLTEPALSAPARRFMLWRLWLWLRKDHHQRLLDCSLSADGGVNLAGGVARLITRLARNAPDARVQDEYWNAAIGIVDELCDVGAPTRFGRGIQPDRLAQLECTHHGHQETASQGETYLSPYLLYWYRKSEH
jgi:hypothetical protein